MGFVNLAELEAEARGRLPTSVFDYYCGGARRGYAAGKSRSV